MLNEPRGFDYAIWLVAFGLYVVDAAKLLSPRDLLLVEDGRWRFTATFSLSPFTLGGRILALGPLLQPYRGIFVAPWGGTWVAGPRLAATLESIERVRGSLLVTRILVTWTFVLLFVVGPLLTMALGPDAAVVYAATGLYPTVLVTVVHLWWQRRNLQLTAVRTLWLSIEMVVCPAFLPNLVRKITAARPLEAEAAQILIAAARAEVKERLLALLASRTEELIEDTSLEPREQEQLRSYLTRVTAAQTGSTEACVP